MSSAPPAHTAWKTALCRWYVRSRSTAQPAPATRSRAHSVPPARPSCSQSALPASCVTRLPCPAQLTFSALSGQQTTPSHAQTDGVALLVAPHRLPVRVPSTVSEATRPSPSSAQLVRFAQQTPRSRLCARQAATAQWVPPAPPYAGQADTAPQISAATLIVLAVPSALKAPLRPHFARQAGSVLHALRVPQTAPQGASAQETQASRPCVRSAHSAHSIVLHLRTVLLGSFVR